MDIALRKGRTMNRFWIAILTAVICVTLSSVGQAVYVTWWVTPAGDSMVNDTTNSLQVHLVGDGDFGCVWLFCALLFDRKLNSKVFDLCHVCSDGLVILSDPVRDEHTDAPIL
jgi:hypothetical protein